MVIRIPSCSPAFYAAYMLAGHYLAIKLSASSSGPGLSEPADKEAAIPCRLKNYKKPRLDKLLNQFNPLISVFIFRMIEILFIC